MLVRQRRCSHHMHCSMSCFPKSMEGIGSVQSELMLHMLCTCFGASIPGRPTPYLTHTCGSNMGPHLAASGSPYVPLPACRSRDISTSNTQACHMPSCLTEGSRTQGMSHALLPPSVRRFKQPLHKQGRITCPPAPRLIFCPSQPLAAPCTTLQALPELQHDHGHHEPPRLPV